MVYYFGVWATSGACLYFGLDILGIDAMQLIERIDMQFGWSLASKVDPVSNRCLCSEKCLEVRCVMGILFFGRFSISHDLSIFFASVGNSFH